MQFVECFYIVEKFGKINKTKQMGYMFVFFADFSLFLLKILDFVDILQWLLQQNKGEIYYFVKTFLAVQKFVKRYLVRLKNK